jgi:hypothetical protein
LLVKLVELFFKFHRGFVTQSAVEPLGVVKGFDAFKDLEFGFGPGERLVFETFGLAGRLMLGTILKSANRDRYAFWHIARPDRNGAGVPGWTTLFLRPVQSFCHQSGIQ